MAFGGGRALIFVDGVTKAAAPAFAVSKGWTLELPIPSAFAQLGPRAAFPGLRKVEPPGD